MNFLVLYMSIFQSLLCFLVVYKSVVDVSRMCVIVDSNSL